MKVVKNIKICSIINFQRRKTQQKIPSYTTNHKTEHWNHLVKPMENLGGF